MNFHFDWLTVVSTHSRPEAAAIWLSGNTKEHKVSTHSRAEAAA